MKRKWDKRLAAIVLSSVLVFSPVVSAHAEEEYQAEPQNAIETAETAPAAEETAETAPAAEETAAPPAETGLSEVTVPDTVIVSDASEPAETAPEETEIPAVADVMEPADGDIVPAAEAPVLVNTDQVTAINESESTVPAADNAAPVADEAVSAAPAVTEAETEIPGVEEIVATRALMRSAAPAYAENIDEEQAGGEGEADGTDEVDEATAEHKEFSVGSEGFSGEEDVFTGWNEEAGSGWKYLSSNQSFVMVNYDGSGKALTFNNVKNVFAAGLNKLGSLISSTIVNLIGTGILQVDEIQLQNDKDLRILPYADLYSEGSVAVFEKDSTRGDSVYTMINGNVTAMLDESYTIPENTTYVIPSGSSVEIGSMATIVDNREIGTTGELVIPESSALEIEDGGGIHMQSCNSTRMIGTTFVSELNAAGTLTVDGSINGQGNIILADTARVEGTGRISAIDIKIASPSVLSGDVEWYGYTMHVSGSGLLPKLKMNGGHVNIEDSGVTIDQLYIVDDTSLILDNPTILNDIHLESGKTLSLYPVSPVYPDVTATFQGKVSGGGSISLRHGTFVLDANSNVQNQYIQSGYYADLYNYSSAYTNQSNVPFRFSPAQALEMRGTRNGEQSSISIPVEILEIGKGIVSRALMGGHQASVNSHTHTQLTAEWVPERSQYMVLTETEQTATDDEGEQEPQIKEVSIAEEITRIAEENFEYPPVVTLFSVDDAGNISVKRDLTVEELQNEDFGNVFLIYFNSYSFLSYTDATSSLSSTNTTITGSGRLGALSAETESSDYPQIPEYNEPEETNGNSQGNSSNTAGNSNNDYASSAEEDEAVPVVIAAANTSAVQSTTEYVVVRPVVNESTVTVEQTGTASQSQSQPQTITALEVKVEKVSQIQTVQQSQSEQQEEQVLQVQQTETTTHYVLSVTDGEKEVEIPKNAVVSVKLKFDVPEEWTQTSGNSSWESSTLYVVFRDANGQLKAFPAQYDRRTGMLIFKSTMLGNFVVVYYPRTGQGNLTYSSAFYNELERLEAVKRGLPLRGN